MENECSMHDNLERILQDPTAEPCDIPLQYLREITNDFSGDRELGEGGFGVVYKGVLPNGEMVAVKNLRSIPQCQEKQFKNEVDSLMRVRHKNIVQFVGYCYETQQKYTKYNGKNVFAETSKMLLCFEYMPNGSLDKYISEESCGLDWIQRYKIIEGICCGLHYLHNECQRNGSLIHLDLKPENVLLDDNMMAKIADFGLAKLFDDNKTQTFATSVVGSKGYMAPEYMFEGIISPMADIYSLGVIILQMITARKFGPSGTETFCQDFVEPVLQNWRNRLEAEPRYASLETDYQQIHTCLEIGISCTDYDRRKRPTARKIIEMLNKWESTNYYVSDEERTPAKQIMPDPKELLEISPLELRFCLELNKPIRCLVKLTNKTDDYVAFYFGDTVAKDKYYIEPTSAFLWPRSTFNVVVTMEQRHELPLDWQCNDEFLVQSIIVGKYYILTSKPLTADMFNNMSSNLVNKVKLTVIYEPPAQLTSLSHIRSEASSSSLPSSLGSDNISYQGETKTSDPQRLEDFPENVDILIMCVCQDLGFSNGRPIAAVVIYRCLLHWKCFEAKRTVLFDCIIQSLSSATEAQDSNDKLAYWLSNSSILLMLLDRTLKASVVVGSIPRRRRSSASLFGRMFAMAIQASPQSAGRPCIEDKYPALLFKQQLTAYLEKFYGMIRDNLKKEISPLLDLCIQVPITSPAGLIKGSKFLAATTDYLPLQSLMAHWQSIVKVLTNYLNVSKANYVPSFLTTKMFTQVFLFINVKLFNSLLLRCECRSFWNGEYVKAGLAELELWCRESEQYAGCAWDELKHIRQAVGFLVIHQKPKLTLKEITSDLCPVLSIPQLYRISTMNQDDKYVTHSVSSEVMLGMRIRMGGDSNYAVSDSFMLDDDSSYSIPFGVDDIARSVTEFEVTDVDIPPSILEKFAFASRNQTKD